ERCQRPPRQTVGERSLSLSRMACTAPFRSEPPLGLQFVSHCSSSPSLPTPETGRCQCTPSSLRTAACTASEPDSPTCARQRATATAYSSLDGRPAAIERLASMTIVTLSCCVTLN